MNENSSWSYWGRIMLRVFGEQHPSIPPNPPCPSPVLGQIWTTPSLHLHTSTITFHQTQTFTTPIQSEQHSNQHLITDPPTFREFFCEIQKLWRDWTGNVRRMEGNTLLKLSSFTHWLRGWNWFLCFGWWITNGQNFIESCGINHSSHNRCLCWWS